MQNDETVIMSYKSFGQTLGHLVPKLGQYDLDGRKSTMFISLTWTVFNWAFFSVSCLESSHPASNTKLQMTLFEALLENVGIPKVVITINSVGTDFHPQFMFNSQTPFQHYFVVQVLKNSTNDSASNITSITKTTPNPEHVSKLNSAKNHYIIGTFSLIERISNSKIFPDWVHAIVILTQERSTLIPQTSAIQSEKSFPQFTFFLNSTGSYRLCHSCSKSHQHSWTPLELSAIKKSQFSPQIQFSLAPFYIKNLGIGFPLDKIPQSWFLLNRMSSLNYRAFLAVQIQRKLNVSVQFCLSQCKRLESVCFLVVINNYFNSYSSTKSYFSLVSFGEVIKFKFLTRRQIHSFDWNWIRGPYETDVLLLFCLTLPIVSISTYFILKSEKDTEDFDTKPLNLLSSFELIVRMVLDQHLEKLPSTSIHFRLGFSSWLLFCIVVTEAYRGEIVGHFIQPSYLQGPSEFEGLTERKAGFTMGTGPMTNATDCSMTHGSNTILALSLEVGFRNLSKHRDLYNRLVLCESILRNVFDIYKVLLDNDNAFIGEMLYLNSFMESFPGQFEQSTESIPKNIYNAVTKNVHFNQIATLFGQLVDTGFIFKHFETSSRRDVAYLKKRLLLGIKNVTRNYDVIGNRVKLSISHFKTLLMLTMGLYISAIVFLLVEKVLEWRENRIRWMTPKVHARFGRIYDEPIVFPMISLRHSRYKSRNQNTIYQRSQPYEYRRPSPMANLVSTLSSILITVWRMRIFLRNKFKSSKKVDPYFGNLN